MSALADRPANPVVGVRAPHESAVLHVTGAANIAAVRHQETGAVYVY